MNKKLFENVSGLISLTLLDYDKHLSAILFYPHCTLRCPYCYNTSIVRNEVERYGSEKIIEFLNKRKNVLDGIVFSGGECTMHTSLYDDIKYCKELGYKIKIDTNGTNPDLIKKLINENLVDYIALDYKCPKDKIERFKFTETTYNNFKNTLDILLEFNIPYEVRTTIHTEVINEKDVNKILQELKELNYKGKFYIQFYFLGTEETIDNSISKFPRKFDTSKLEIPNGISIEFRNEEDNEKL